MNISSRHSNCDAQDPNEVTVTCFGKKKGKKSGIACNSILVETEGLIRDLRQEVTQLRHAQSGKSEEMCHMEATVERLRGEKETLMEERGGLKEELVGLKMEKRDLEQRLEKLVADNEELVSELQDRSRELNLSMASATDEQQESSRTTETLRHQWESSKRSLLEVNQKLLHRANELKELQMQRDASKAEVERLSEELSKLEVWKVVTMAEIEVKVADISKKYTALKRVCRGKDMLINKLRDEKSKALMQLWQTAYGHTAKQVSCMPTHADRQIPTAAIEPFQTGGITDCNATSPVKCQGACRGKDMLINKLRDEKSKALMQLWQTAYGHTAKQVSCMPTHADRQIPTAAIEPFQTGGITDCNATSPVKCQDIGDEMFGADFIKNKTMSMELELFRKRKTAEIFGDNFSPLAPDAASTESNSTCSGSGCDVSASLSDFIHVVLDDAMDQTLDDTDLQLLF